MKSKKKKGTGVICRNSPKGAWHKRLPSPFWVAALLVLASAGPEAVSMCGYFRPVIVDIKQPAAEILQPSQIAFITWDPQRKIETVSVQPRFEGNARDFGMVIPTPSQPKLDEMPRDFFKALGVFTLPKKREFPQSRLLPMPVMGEMALGAKAATGGRGPGGQADQPRPTTVAVLEVGLVGSLEYKIITAGRPDDLFNWLKDNKYNFAGDEATLDYYLRKKYFFTVMKIDTLQMKKNPDGSYTGDVTPTRFTFATDNLVYPLKITQVSVKDKTEALFYVQAPFKVDLPGEQSYLYQWVSMLQHVQATMGLQELTNRNRSFMEAIRPDQGDLLRRAGELGFTFQLNASPRPNKEGRLPTTLEWAKKLTEEDLRVLTGARAFSETVPDPDDGFTRADLRDPAKAPIIFRAIQKRLAKYQQDRPRGYLVRKAAAEDLKLLPLLKGHIQPGQYLTKFRHVFVKEDMNDDLVMVQARVADVPDTSEHEEVLRTRLWRGGRGPIDFEPGPGRPRPRPIRPGLPRPR